MAEEQIFILLMKGIRTSVETFGSNSWTNISYSSHQLECWLEIHIIGRKEGRGRKGENNFLKLEDDERV